MLLHGPLVKRTLMRAVAVLAQGVTKLGLAGLAAGAGEGLLVAPVATLAQGSSQLGLSGDSPGALRGAHGATSSVRRPTMARKRRIAACRLEIRSLPFDVMGKPYAG
jgi:hypothetical protein